MHYNINNDGSKGFDPEIAFIIIQIWNDPVVTKMMDQESGKFYLMDSAP